MKKWHPLLFLILTALAILACNLSVSNSATPSSSLISVDPEESDSVRSTSGPESTSMSAQGEPVPATIPKIATIHHSPYSSTGTANQAPAVASSTTVAPIVAQPPQPSISYFRSSDEQAEPGDTVTVEWMTSNAITVTLWHLAPTGQFGRYWDVPKSGSFDYIIDLNERNYSRFALFASIDADNSEMATLSILLNCPDDWFFSQAPDICPAFQALSSAGAVQQFESGFMIWIEEEEHIYVLFDDSGSPGWNTYVDQWDPSDPDRDPTLLPPDDLYQPVRGFGRVWREEPGVRDRLGWAVNEEQGYSTIIQRTSYAKYNETYILALDGGVWRLLPERSEWQKITSE